MTNEYKSIEFDEKPSPSEPKMIQQESDFSNLRTIEKSAVLNKKSRVVSSLNANQTVLDSTSRKTGLRFNRKKTKVQSVSHNDGCKNDLSHPHVSDLSEDFISSVVDSESIYRHMTAEDAKIANRLLTKNTILKQKCPDTISEFHAQKGSGDDLYSLPEKSAKEN